MSVVYFAQAASGQIKIGHTIGLERRLSHIQLCTPTKITLLTTVSGGKEAEFYFHELLKAHVSFGEWYHPTSEVLRAVADVREHGAEAIPIQFRLKPANSPFRPITSTDVVNDALMWIEGIASPSPFSEKIGQRLGRVSRLSGVSPRTLKSLWYGEISTIEASNYLALKECFDAKMAALSGNSAGDCEQ